MNYQQANPFSFAYFTNKSAFTILNWNQNAQISLKTLQDFKIPDQKPQIQDKNNPMSSENQEENKFLNFKNTSISNQQLQREFEKNSIRTSRSESFSEKNEGEKLEDLSVQEKQMYSNYRKTRLRNRKPLKYDFDSDSQTEQKETKPCQTKNIIKNFVRSVLSFIKKNQTYQNSILTHLHIDQVEFLEFLQQIQGKMNTISQLRGLWTSSKYNKAFRCISSHFLRAYYPKHIFHSRIFNHNIHLKYRIKLLKSLEKPQDFTSLKQF